MLARVRANRYFASLVAAGVGAMVIPGLAWAGSGPGTGGVGTGPGAGTNPNVQSGAGTVSATGDGITISSAASAFVRSGVSVSGSVPAGDAGAAVEIDQLPAPPGSSWVPVAVVKAASNGTFTAAWHTKGAGQLTIRAILQGTQASTTAASSPPALSVTVYKRSIATLYGPGFWGHKTACGVTLRRRTIGVANRTLPCGTQVELYYKGSVMTVPVIDRGPYAHHANWDLTMATGRALGMTGTAVVGAASVSAAASAAAPASSGVPGAQ